MSCIGQARNTHLFLDTFMFRPPLNAIALTIKRETLHNCLSYIQLHSLLILAQHSLSLSFSVLYRRIYVCDTRVDTFMFRPPLSFAYNPLHLTRHSQQLFISYPASHSPSPGPTLIYSLSRFLSPGGHVRFQASPTETFTLLSLKAPNTILVFNSLRIYFLWRGRRGYGACVGLLCPA